MPTKNISVCSHLEPDLSDAFDAYRRAQPKIPTASKAVAHLMRLGLQVEARRKRSKPEHTVDSGSPAASDQAQPAERDRRQPADPEIIAA